MFAWGGLLHSQKLRGNWDTDRELPQGSAFGLNPGAIGSPRATQSGFSSAAGRRASAACLPPFVPLLRWTVCFGFPVPVPCRGCHGGSTRGLPIG